MSGTRRRRGAVRVRPALLLGIGLALAGGRELRAEEISARYAAYWAGLPAAEIRIDFGGAPGAYRDRIEIETTGVPRWTTSFRAVATSEGRVAADGAAVAVRYQAVFDLRRSRDRHISLSFPVRAGARMAEREPDDNSRKPPLAEEFRRDVVDPLAALEGIRGWLRASGARQSGATIRVYDGARRFDVETRLLSRPDKPAEPVTVEMILRGIAGFKEEGEDGQPDPAPRRAEASFSNDRRALPLSLSVSVAHLPLIVQLERVCRTTAECSN